MNRLVQCALIAGLTTIAVQHSPLHSPASVRAENAFSWEDRDGNIFFGGKPPVGAKNVKSVAGKSFSRYSSEKLLRPYRARAALKEAEIKESDLSAVHLPPPPIPGAPGAEEELPLEAQPVAVEYNAEHQVTKCEVIIKNPAAIPIGNFTVSFEFADGTLISASGPTEIGPQTEGKFIVPPEGLPLALKTAATAEQPQPKVVIQALPETGSFEIDEG
jgi:hypothetical protein